MKNKTLIFLALVAYAAIVHASTMLNGYERIRLEGGSPAIEFIETDAQVGYRLTMGGGDFKIQMIDINGNFLEEIAEFEFDKLEWQFNRRVVLDGVGIQITGKSRFEDKKGIEIGFSPSRQQGEIVAFDRKHHILRPILIRGTRIVISEEE